MRQLASGIRIMMISFFLMFCYGIAQASSTSSFSPSAIKKISYVCATSVGYGRSAMGHSYLRLSTGDQLSSNDLTVEFLADVEDQDLNYLKALGILGTYRKKVVTAPFFKIAHEMNIGQDRDLFTYELDLKPEQVLAISKQVETLVNIGFDGDYSFLSSNCASSVSKILSIVGFDSGPLDGNLPNKIPSLLRDRHLIAKTSMDNSSTNARKLQVQLHQQLFDSISSPFIDKISDRLQAQDPMTRLSTLIYLQQNIHTLTENQTQELRIFLYSYALFESPVVKEIIVKNINGGRYSIIFSRREKIPSVERYSIPKIESTRLVCEEPVCFITMSIVANLNSGNSADTKAISYKFKSPITLQDQGLFYKGNKIGIAQGSTQNDHFENPVLFGANLLSDLKVSDESYFAQAYIVIDWNDSRLWNKQDINNDQIIPLTNSYEQYPSCYSLVYLQKYMLENVLFMPELPKLSAQENMNLVAEMFQEKIVIVPGFKSPNEFLKSMDPLQLIQIIFQIHDEKDRSLAASIKMLWTSSEASVEDFKYIQQITSAGISVPIIFRVGQGGEGHSFLITGVQDKGDVIELSGMDPNIRQQDRFRKDLAYFRKSDSKLVTVGYGTTTLRIPPLNLSEAFSRLQFTKGALSSILKSFPKRTSKYSLTLDEFLKLK